FVGLVSEFGRRHLIIFVIVMLVLTLVACGEDAAPEATPIPQQLRVSILTNQIAPQGDLYLEGQILNWGRENGFEVSFVRNIADTANSPDCGQISGSAMPELLLTDKLVEITALVNDLGQGVGGFTTGALTAVSNGGKYWAVPYASSTYVFFVRQDKLDAFGLPTPNTWEDALVAASEMHISDEFWGWGMQLGDTGDTRASFRAQLWAFGGSIWDEAGEPAIDSLATRQVLDFLSDAWDRGLIPPDAINWAEDSNNRAFITGQVGMVLNAGTILTYLLENDAEMLDNTTVTLIPEGPAGRFIGGGFLQWVLFKQSEQISACLSLTEWLFAPDRLRGYYEAASGTYLPTSPALLNDELWQRPHLKDVAKMVPYTYATGYPGPTTPWALQAMQTDFIPKMVRRVLVEGWTTDEAIREADETLWRIHGEWEKRLN
ncbi:MAG: extracellular solute-binding protein, partial [Chloroflexota bacterium]